MLNILTALSLLICLAGIVTWGRSHKACDNVHVIRGLRAVSRLLNLLTDPAVLLCVAACVL